MRSANRKTLLVIAAAALGLAALLAFLFKERSAETPRPRAVLLRIAGEAYHTSYQVKVVGEGLGVKQEPALRGAIEKELQRVNLMMSRYLPESELSRFNREAGTAPFKVSPEIASLIAQSERLSELSQGAFDVTVAPLVRFWGFNDGTPLEAEPDPALLEAERAKVGYKMLKVDRLAATLTKARPDLEVDLSAIAKGYAVDCLGLVLERKGFTRYLVEIGGEVRARGTNDRGVSWRIAVEEPVAERRKPYKVLSLRDAAVATSGDYRNFYEIDGRRYSHTIDPRQGRPISHALASVTVIDRDCATADGLATAINALGPDEGFALAERLGLKVLLLIHDENGGFSERSTPSFDSNVIAAPTSPKR